MLRAIVEAGEHGPRLGGNNRHFVIVACKLADGGQRVKPHDGDKFNFRASIAAQQLNAVEPGNAPVLDPDEDFLFEQRLISIGVLRRGPAVLDADDHGGSPFMEIHEVGSRA